MMIKIYNEDCYSGLRYITDDYDVIITSPPYNIGIDYGTYKDNLKTSEYLDFIDTIFDLISKRVTLESHIFLNIGYTNKDPFLGSRVANVVAEHFKLQNNIVWIKSITVGDDSFGHFKPISSDRFLTPMWEHIFHFTVKGEAKIDRLRIGVPYKDKSNIKRYSKNGDLRCGGNTWFIPYETTMQKKNHPATFPELLVEKCLLMTGKSSGNVLDPFMGIGTTGKVAKRMGFNFTGFEIDKDYFEYAKTNI